MLMISVIVGLTVGLTSGSVVEPIIPSTCIDASITTIGAASRHFRCNYC